GGGVGLRREPAVVIRRSMLHNAPPLRQAKSINHRSSSHMADETETTQPGQPNQARGPQVIIDERDLQMVYTNAYRIHAADDVVVDFGYNMPNPNPPQQGQQQVLYKGTHRVIMSYANAKRLAGSLGQLIKRYEQQFGEIKLPMPQQQPPQGGTTH